MMEIVRVKRPPVMIDIEVLAKCSKGIARRIKKAKRKGQKEKRKQLKSIKKEIDDLIEAL